MMALQGKVNYNIINLYLLSYGNVTVEIVNNIEYIFLQGTRIAATEVLSYSNFESKFKLNHHQKSGKVFMHCL